MGQFYYGGGEHSIDGPSEESRFLANPFLLVAAEFQGLSIWAPGTSGPAWDRGRIRTELLHDPGFPLFCPPERLQWWPRQARAEVTCDVSKYLAEVSVWTTRPLSLASASFDLVAYNVRDMNLNYLFFSVANSENVAPPEPTSSPVLIAQYIHRGDIFGYPGGCSNMSPRVDALCDYRLEGLPARAAIRLWARRPANVASPHDMLFVIQFR